MPIVTTDCPHCFTKHIALQLAALRHVELQNFGASLYCPKCKMPSAAILQTKDFRFTVHTNEVMGKNSDITELNLALHEIWPNFPEPSAPVYIPPDVERVYLQGERNFTTEGNEEAAGMLYRKALDIGLKKIDPELKGTLGARIKKLRETGKLTNDIAEWADQIKTTGNEAAHEEEPITKADLEELRSFTDMVLRYLFTLPNMVKKRRGQRLDWEPQS